MKDALKVKFLIRMEFAKILTIALKLAMEAKAPCNKVLEFANATPSQVLMISATPSAEQIL